MLTVHFFTPDADKGPSEQRVQAGAGTSLMQAAVDAGVAGIQADCGGMLSCATCHVLVHERWLARLPAMHEDESAMLELTAVQRQPNSRLSCQLLLSDELDGLAVDLPKTQY